MKPQKRIILCLAHMSGNEERYIKEAFDTNWVVPLGPNVNGFEDDLKRFIASPDPSDGRGQRNPEQWAEEGYPKVSWRMRMTPRSCGT